jgi:hypothetical protein
VEKVIITIVLPTVVLVLMAMQFCLAQTNQTTIWTKYTDPEGRFSINYPVDWTGVHASNRFQDMLAGPDHPPYTALFIDVLPTNVTDPSVFANAYNTNRSSIAIGFSILQNLECVKYQIQGQKACSHTIKITKPKGTNLEGEQVFSYVNSKMLVFTMVAKQGELDGYLPIFHNMLASFRSPPDTSETPNPAQSSQPPPAVRNPQFIPQPPLFPPYQQQQPYSFPLFPLQPNYSYPPPTILSQSAYTNSIGNLHIVGEVINQSPVTANSVKIIATFYNAYNQVVGTDYVYAQPSNLAPGQRAPFELIELSGSIPMNQVRNYVLSVTSS